MGKKLWLIFKGVSEPDQKLKVVTTTKSTKYLPVYMLFQSQCLTHCSIF